MIGVGVIYNRYASGDLIDDSDVAQVHGPQELGCILLSEPFVNVEATVRRAKSRGDLSAEKAQNLITLARQIFFKELTLETLANRTGNSPPSAETLLETLRRNHVDAKRDDALALVNRLASLPDTRSPVPTSWSLATPAVWQSFLSSLGVQASVDIQ